LDISKIFSYSFLEKHLIKDKKLSSFTTYQIGGYPLGILNIKDHNSFIKALYNLSNRIPYRIIGKGSNLLITDSKVEFWVITGKYRSVESYRDNKKIYFFVTPFTELQYFINLLIENGVSGYESLAAIPATVGGAVFNNAGIKNLEISKYLKKVTIFDRKRRKFMTLNIDSSFFGYRTSYFKEELLNNNPLDLVHFVFEFPLENIKDKNFLKSVYLETYKRRMESQPLDQKSCGSVFKNLPYKPAWEIISSLGYRGYTVGGAKVSEKHANFIVNFSNATFNNVFTIIQDIKKRAMDYGFYLEEEVEIWK